MGLFVGFAEEFGLGVGNADGLVVVKLVVMGSALVVNTVELEDVAGVVTSSTSASV